MWLFDLRSGRQLAFVWLMMAALMMCVAVVATVLIRNQRMPGWLEIAIASSDDVSDGSYGIAMQQATRDPDHVRIIIKWMDELPSTELVMLLYFVSDLAARSRDDAYLEIADKAFLSDNPRIRSAATVTYRQYPYPKVQERLWDAILDDRESDRVRIPAAVALKQAWKQGQGERDGLAYQAAQLFDSGAPADVQVVVMHLLLEGSLASRDWICDQFELLVSSGQLGASSRWEIDEIAGMCDNLEREPLDGG